MLVHHIAKDSFQHQRTAKFMAGVFSSTGAQLIPTGNAPNT
jgi:methylmalonyl-CoA mutase cobalamin-binding subunit